MAEIDMISAEIAFEATATDSSSHAASMSSTPPTTVSPDNISLASDLSKAEHSQLALQDDISDLHEPEQAIAAQLAATAQTAHNEQIIEQSLPGHAADSVAAPTLPILQILSGHVEPSKPEAPLTPTAPAIVVAPSPKSAAAPVSTPATASPARPRRAGADAKVYNIAKLVGTDIHGKRAAKGDDISKRRRRTKEVNDAYRNAIAAGASEEAANEARAKVQAEHQAASAASSANSTPRVKKVRSVKLSTPKSSPAKLAFSKKASSASPGSSRAAIHASFAQTPSFVSKPSTLGKRDRRSFESEPESGSRMSRELRRLQDTKEYAHIDEKPVVYTVWSKGKYIEVEDVDDPVRTPPRKKAKLSKSPKKEETPQKKEVTFAVEEAPRQKVPKKWLERGLYAGQQAPEDITKTLIATEKKKLAEHPELLPWSSTNKALPLPLFNGFRMLLNGRNFKLPFDICNPLPPGQPKPPSYRTMTRNRFIRDAAAYWKKTPHFQDYQSTCICKPEDGCGEQCQNRVMLYECTVLNCNVGRKYCTNRAFENLTERVKRGGRYRVGVEVFKTENRGFGVRSNRCFQPRQIVMEYSGEIITEDECDERMHGIYKDNECYYLMSFDQKMIIDATSGSMARFVNHSCSPNCEMIKWVVNGLPRMALFAGCKPIMTGDELTYDYNFAPFSNNIQECLCGSDNCRGVLGPRPRDVKPPAAKLAKVVGKGKKSKKLKAKLLGAARSSSASPKKSLKAVSSPKSPKGGAKHTVSSVKVKKVLVATKGGSKASKVVMKKTKVVKRTVGTARGLKKVVKGSAKRKVGRPRKLGSIDVKVPAEPPKVLFPKLKAIKEAQAGAEAPVESGNVNGYGVDLDMGDAPVAKVTAKASPKAQKVAQAIPKALAKVLKKQQTLDAMFNPAALSKQDKVKKAQSKAVESKEVVAKVKKGVEGAKKLQGVKEKKTGIAQAKTATADGKGTAKAFKEKMAKQTPPGAIKRGPGRPRKDGSWTPSPATKTKASSTKMPGSATKTADSIEAVRTPTKSVVSTSQKTTVLTSSGRKRTLTQKSIEAAEMWDIPGAAANLKPRISPKSAKAAQAAETPDASIQVHTQQPVVSQMEGIMGSI